MQTVLGLDMDPISALRVAMIVLNDMTVDPRVTREATALSQAGYEVAVFCLRRVGLPDIQEVGGFTVLRVADNTTATTRQPVKKRAQHHERNRALSQAVTAWQPDLIHCHDANTVPAGRVAQESTGARFVFDAHELYAESLQQLRFQRTWPVQRYWRRAEADACRMADAIITVSDGLRDVLLGRSGKVPTVIENVPELGPMGDRTLLRSTLGITSERPIVLYQGGLFVGRGLDELVDAVAELDCELVFQGRGPGEQWVRERAAHLGMSDRVHLMGWVEPQRLLSLTCGADVGTCFLDGVTLNHQLAWPNRVFMYFMAGIPSAVTDLPGLGALIRDYDAGVTAEPRDTVSIRSALERLLADDQLRARLGENARRAAENRFNWDLASERLLEVYAGLDAAGA